MFKKYLQIVLVVFILFAIGLVQRSFENSTEYQLRPIVFFGCQFTSLAISLATLEFLRKIKNQLIRFFFTLGASSLVAIVAFIFFTSEVELLLLLRVAIAFSMAFTIAERMQLLDYRSQELRELYEKKEKIERALLSQQLNPHFLFNSLNTLKGLIEEDKSNAISYVHDFAKVYRYILKINPSELVKLEDELKLISSYYNLLKCRFGDNFILKQQIGKSFLQKLVPPLALQLLVENAIKHNEVSNSRPLELNIKAEGTDLYISNPIQEKLSFDESNGLGLSNLSLRYKYALGLDITYEVTDTNYFVVKIPLMDNSN
jgi:LytS/YehU family sensor histidine kinase